MVTSTEEGPKKKPQPQLVKLDKALKLAEEWVNSMSKSPLEVNSAPLELEGRPARLGIGATVPRESKHVLSNNPVERKLFSKLQTAKSNASKRDESVALNGADGKVDEESDEDEPQSRSKAVSKKRPLSWTSPLNSKKKKHR